MDNKTFAFRYPPPPPPIYSTNRPPPLPADSPAISKPPPPPPPAAIPSWGSFDFSHPPPPFSRSTPPQKPFTSNITSPLGYAVKLRQNTLPKINLPSQEGPSYYNQDTSNYYGVNNKQSPLKRYKSETVGNTQAWVQRNNNFRKPRFDSRIEQRNEQNEHSFYRTQDSRYNRSSSNTDTRYPFQRDQNNQNSVDSNSNSESKYQEDGHRSRKRKKPLSQSVPAKRAWTDEEAQMAIDVEREYNKLFKNHSLKIKFPDQELNRDIVSKFHSTIETVYFQQPSNPRFCFVTLADGADPNEVIEELNKIKFGLGYLSAEYKKDREEEQNVGPEDIDPLTLYVGNLAQEVTKEDMVNFFPKNKRIDIGFAKKMRYTRYAFVSFKNVQDSIDAFKATHYADLHSKSMIVRFRRLHGTVGMPGEPKIQHPSKENNDVSSKRGKDVASSDKSSASYLGQPQNLDNDETYGPSTSYEQRFSSPGHSPHHRDYDHRTTSECSDSSNFDPSLVKSEPYDYRDDDFEDCHSDDDNSRQNRISLDQNEVTETCTKCEEEINEIDPDTVVKKEPEFITPFLPDIPDSMFPVRPIPLKEEPSEQDEGFDDVSLSTVQSLPNGMKEPKKEVKNENVEPVNPEDNEEEFNTTTDFGSVLDNLQRRPNFMP